jgi:hypothetical protein
MARNQQSLQGIHARIFVFIVMLISKARDTNRCVTNVTSQEITFVQVTGHARFRPLTWLDRRHNNDS